MEEPFQRGGSVLLCPSQAWDMYDIYGSGPHSVVYCVNLLTTENRYRWAVKLESPFGSQFMVWAESCEFIESPEAVDWLREGF